MRLQQAKRKLLALVKNEYHFASCRLVGDLKRNTSQECQLYVNPGILVTADTFEECFEKLKEYELEG